MQNKMLPVVSKMMPIIVEVTDKSIMFMEINFVVENNSSELYAKYPDIARLPTPGNP